MDVTQLSNKTIELSDITAWDKNGNKLLVSKVRARNIVEDITAKVEDILKFEYEHKLECKCKYNCKVEVHLYV